jgi:hypothetical protein
MMSQIDLTNADSDRVPAITLGTFDFRVFFTFGMTNFQKIWRGVSWASTQAPSSVSQ